jgi:hypothetical protein
LRDRILGTARERQSDVVARGEPPGELASFRRAAEDEDSFHGARCFGIAPHPYPQPFSFDKHRFAA